MSSKDYDAVVVGSGPNGLAAAITLQQEGLSVLLLEAKEETGGGLRSKALTLPGYLHDVCSAIHPMAAASPFFRSLPLGAYGLEFIQPPLPAAHPFEDGSVAVLHRSLPETASGLGVDAAAYRRLVAPVAKSWDGMIGDILGPLAFPAHPLDMAAFGLKALPSALWLSRRFRTREARGLWAGMAAHSQMPLSGAVTAAIGLVLMTAAHTGGWPLVRGGSGALAQALTGYFTALGGKTETGVCVKSLNELPPARAVLLDVTPRQLLQIAGERLSPFYRRQLQGYRYGMGVFKIDWALDGPIPFRSAACRQAGTVHLGNTLEEIAASEHLTWKGGHPERPFVLLAQQSLFDPSRAPAGKHTAWAYCHVPHGSLKDMTVPIEQQVERFAPGFRDRVLARHTLHTAQLEAYNPNYIGGDINGGVSDLGQLFTRPTLRLSPYRTSAGDIYICSSSTPPGGGVHGMCGYHAARRALKDVFGIS
ncbi:NAD(P)/FAD-dependent oxidoreductase [Compostibacter hankyongensis]|uniref:NAD(P)/FAD-dependent oxidoreductase n=1 Tax=Compostibacter hankyongensis TaxID=1007089 RepID=A0ABP8FVB8_9BACT